MGLADVINLGPRTSAWLDAAGFTSLAQVRRHGVVATALAVRAHGHAVSFNLVLALQGALMGCDWRRIPTDVRQRLRTEWDSAR